MKLELRVRRALTRCLRGATALSLFALAGCQRDAATRDDHLAVGKYVLQTGKDTNGALAISRSTTLNADHTFTDVESIRITKDLTSDWSSSGTWTVLGIRLIKVHRTPNGPMTELAMLVGDTVKAGRSMLVRE